MKDYIRDTIKPNDIDNCYFDTYDPSELETIIKTQQQVLDYQKSQTHECLYHILIVIDDFADDTSFTRTSQLLHQLYIYIYIFIHIRGRHYMVSTIASTQLYKQISPIVRNNMTHLFIYRLRNYGDLESIIEEMSATYDKNILLHIYHETIEEPCSFIVINLMQRDKHKMLLKSFTQYLKSG